jgi:hypothetical protein
MTVLGTGVTGGGTPNMVTTPEKFKALIASQRAERALVASQPAVAELPSGLGLQITPEQWRVQLGVRRALTAEKQERAARRQRPRTQAM